MINENEGQITKLVTKLKFIDRYFLEEEIEEGMSVKLNLMLLGVVESIFQSNQYID